MDFFRNELGGGARIDRVYMIRPGAIMRMGSSVQFVGINPMGAPIQFDAGDNDIAAQFYGLGTEIDDAILLPMINGTAGTRDSGDEFGIGRRLTDKFNIERFQGGERIGGRLRLGGGAAGYG